MRASRWKAVLSSLVICLGLPLTAAAQQFRIYTKVYDETQVEPGQKPSIAVRSLSLFHAGKTFDYIDATGEVTIFEPAAERFTILHTSRMLATTLTFQELDELLGRAVTQAETFVQLPKDDKDPAWETRRDLIKFQLHPEFQQTYLPKQQRLTFASPQFTYDIRVAPAKSPEDLTTYLRYADRVAQLNYVLHSQAFLPIPRLVVNEGLRQKKVLPLEVTLRAEIGRGVQLRAVHQFTWPLDTTDRQLIHKWETLLNSPEMRRVPFEEFHQELLAEKPRKRS
jgi:hypothetical protein